MPAQESPATLAPAPPSLHVDIAIIGAGVAGTSAAAALANAGHSVALVDFRERHAPEFRAEKIGDRQVAFLDAFGLGQAARRQLTAFDGVWEHRFGLIVEHQRKREYSSPYGDLANALRDALSPSVHRLIGRVIEVKASAELQSIVIADGRTITARLLVVATGLGETIRQKLGISLDVISPGHTLAGGFDLANPVAGFPFPSLVWISERPVDRMAYLTLFPMGGRMRGNIFVYRAANDPWSMRLRRSPDAALAELLPDLASRFGALHVEGTVQVRPIDLAQVTGHKRPGVVLIGDAFFTTCPVTGTGMDKALNDVDVLRRHAANWLSTPGMALDKITAFYGDPTKLAVDAASLKLSRRERAIRMDQSALGKLLRLRRNLWRGGAYRAQAALQWGRGPFTSRHAPQAVSLKD